MYVLSLREIKISIGAPQLEPGHDFVEGVASNSTIKLLITMLFQWGINFIANLSHFVVIIGESVFSYVIYCFGPFILDDSVAKRQDEYICRFYRNCLRGTQKNLEWSKVLLLKFHLPTWIKCETKPNLRNASKIYTANMKADMCKQLLAKFHSSTFSASLSNLPHLWKKSRKHLKSDPKFGLHV